jgi:hypothetical protein
MVITASLASACNAPPPPAAAPAPTPVEAVVVPEPVAETAVRVDSGVKYGDCAEALRRAVAQPDLDVDSLPAPVAYKPVPIDVTKMPRGVLSKTGYSEVRITVVVDTLGKADMKTFTVVTSTHPWLTQSVKTAVGKWSFHPAMLAGCKVPRAFKWGAMSGTRPPDPPDGRVFDLPGRTR